MKITIMAQGVQPGCIGRFFRYTESGFKGQNGRLVQTKEIRPLKSISCPGCAECAVLDEDLATRAKEMNFVQFSPELKSGDTVTLFQVPVLRDRETGLLEEWYYEVQRADTP